MFQGVVQVSDDRLVALANGTAPPAVAEPPPGTERHAIGSSHHYVAALWMHECERVLGDKLVNDTDKSWLRRTALGLVGKVRPFSSQWGMVAAHSLFDSNAQCSSSAFREQAFGPEVGQQLERPFYFAHFLRDPPRDELTDEPILPRPSAYEAVPGGALHLR